jgi:putative transposase
VYIWADGLHFRVRLGQAHLCCLVIVGVRADGTKALCVSVWWGRW